MQGYIAFGVIIIIVIAVSLFFSEDRLAQEDNNSEIEHLVEENRDLKERVSELEHIVSKSEDVASTINIANSFFEAESIEELEPLVLEVSYNEEFNSLYVGNSILEWQWNVGNTKLTDFSFDGDENIVLDYEIEYEIEEQFHLMDISFKFIRDDDRWVVNGLDY